MIHADGGAVLNRILRGTPARLSVVFDDDETPVDDGPVTVTVTDPAGAEVSTGPAAGDGAGGYTYTLPAQADLTRLAVTWTGQTRTVTTFAEIVGGFLFTLADARASDPALSDPTKYPTERLKVGRLEVEDEFELCLRVSYVPRYDRVLFDGDLRGQRLLLPALRRLLSVTIDGAAQTAPQLAALAPDPYGGIAGLTGKHIAVEYEHGLDSAPSDLRRAALTRLRYNLVSEKSGIPDRATQFHAGDGGTFTLALPGRSGFQTGIPEVDAVLARRRWGPSVA